MPSPKRIGKIEFGLLSPKEIRQMSVRKIIWADTYDDDGFPYPQGLMDLHLGVIDQGLGIGIATGNAMARRIIAHRLGTPPHHGDQCRTWRFIESRSTLQFSNTATADHAPAYRQLPRMRPPR